MATERAYWLAWSRIKNVGPVAIKRLWEHFGSLEVAWRASAGDLLAVDGIGLLIAEGITAQRPKLNPEALLTQHEKENRAFWTPADVDYPALLFAINDPPPVLYYHGNLRLNNLRRLNVGIVGTRSPTPYGKRWTQNLSAGLVQAGAVIVSGLAQGIDTCAHESCLQAGGLTVAVVGTGVDRVYPAQNRELHRQIVKRGLILSEYPDGTGPDRKHFPQRNRIIAGLSRALLVTEAPEKSGALITARLANEYCREVYALPCSLDNEKGLGCLRVIEQGAQMILNEQTLMDALVELPPVDVVTPAPVKTLVASERELDAGDSETFPQGSFTDQLPSSENLAQPQLVPVPDLSPLLVNVLNAVSIEPISLDQIVPLAQTNVGEALAALFELEMLGLVTPVPGGTQYQRA